MPRRLKSSLRELAVLPRQFWVLTLGIFVYMAAAAVAFPYESIYLRTELHVSMTLIGVVFGVVPIAVMPFQFWGGHLTDRFGRRSMLLLATLIGVVWFVGFAYVTEVWQVAALVALESAFGWPLFQTASNAMIADLLPPERRQEGFGVTRVAMNLGCVLGPSLAGFALGFGASFKQLFLAAAVGGFLILVVMALMMTESRPLSAVAFTRVRGGTRGGYRAVFADRVFIVFCVVAVLPVFCFGNFGTNYSVYMVDVLEQPYTVWGWLLALNAAIVAIVQYPLVRATRHKNRMILLAVSSALVALGLGGSAFAGPLWSLVVLVMVTSLGETLLSPIATAEVSDLAPEALRGRYMGVWTVIWNCGASLGLAAGGRAMDVFGGRGAFATLLAVGMIGAAFFLALAPGWRRRREAARAAI